MVYFTFRSPRVQAYLTKQLTEYISKELDAKVEVGGININIFLNIVLEDVVVYDQQKNILLKSGKLVFNMRGFSYRNRTMTIRKLVLDETYLNLTRYENEETFNYQFLVDYFSTDAPRDPIDFNWKVVCNSFEFKNAGFTFNDKHEIIKIPAFNSSLVEIADFNLFLADIVFYKNSVDFNLRHFSLSERQGFLLENISGLFSLSETGIIVDNLKAATPATSIRLDATAEFDGLDAFDDFFNDVTFDVNFYPSRISISDVAKFVEILAPLKDSYDILSVNGGVSGSISNMRGRNFKLHIGRHTVFDGNFNLSGLPILEETFINFSINEFSSSMTAINNYYSPFIKDQPELMIPDSYFNIGNVKFDGSFTGFVNDFVAYGNLYTDIGSVSTDMIIRSLEDNRKVEYSGALSGANLNIGKLLEQEDAFGMLNFESELIGSGVDINTLNIEINGNLNSFEILGYNYENIKLLGILDSRRFNGEINIDDENVSFDFLGLIDFQDDVQHFDFNMRLDKLNLTHLNIYQRDTLYNSIIASDINMNFTLESFENGEGNIIISNAKYNEFGIDSLYLANELSIDSIAVTSNINGTNRRKITINSDVVDASIDGSYSLSSIATSFNRFLYHYMPSWYDNEPVFPEHLSAGNDSFDFSVVFKNTREITDIFLPGLILTPETSLNGSFCSENNDLVVESQSSVIYAFGNVIRNFEIIAGKNNGLYEFGFMADRVLLTDSMWIDNFQAAGGLSSDTLKYSFNWDNHRFKNKTMGDIHGIIAFNRLDNFDLKFYPSRFIVNDSLWEISADNHLYVDSTEFVIKNFKVYKNDEYISLDGIVSKKADKKLQLAFNDFNISNFDLLLKDLNLDFDGIISGDVSLMDVYGTMNVDANVNIKDFGFNHDHLGDLIIESKWDNEHEGLFIDGRIIYYGNVGSNTPATFKGFIFPTAEEENFDLDIDLVNLRLSIFGRYLEGFASGVRGLGTGKLRLEGPFASPELSGNVGLMRTGLRVDYINVPYFFSHNLEVQPQHFKFEDVEIFDSIGNSGFLSGIVKHNNFKDFSVDVSVKPERMILLNTRYSPREMFYGRAFASGIAHIHGPANDIIFDISARTNRGTQIFLPVEYSGEVRETQFITFVSKDTIINAKPNDRERTVMGLTLNFDLEVTPEAELQIIFDSQVGDIMRGRGTGNIAMEINPQGEFAMYGDFTIQDGDYLFTLQNLINKRFRIQEGGTIRWMGDPFDANVDLKAMYRLRTSLYDLMMEEVDTADVASDVYRRRVPVDVVLDIGETLFNPSIAFNIDLPGSDEATKEAVERIISTEHEMNRQVFSLLVLSSFMPTETMQYNIGHGVGATSSELLSNQLSNWLSQISSEVDIGFNYRPGDEISAQEFEMALSTQLFDDRVLIDGNFGVAGDRAAAQQASNIIGDVNVEVKVTPEGKFRLKAFNRSNVSDVLNQNAPYTQGVGVFYRKEFDSFDELFRNRRRTTPMTFPDLNGIELPSDSDDEALKDKNSTEDKSSEE